VIKVYDMKFRNKLVIKKYMVKVMIIYFIYRVFLDIIYINWVSPIYSYSGLVYEPNIYKIVISYTVMMIITLIISKKTNKVSYIVLQLHYIIMIIPLLSMYSLANLSTKFLLMVSFCFIIQIILIKVLPIIKINSIKNIQFVILLILGVITVITYFYLLKTQDLNISVFDISSIYKIRSEQNIKKGIISYFITWQYRIINPIFIIILYLKRKYLLFSGVILMQVLLYLMYPHKEIVLAIALIFIALFVERKKYRFDLVFIAVLSTISIIGVGLVEVIKKRALFSVLPVRMLFVPAQIKFLHYDFFLLNEKLYYSEGLIGKILNITYPYGVSSGFLVGSPVSNENTGYIAYAYDNFGFIGMIGISLVFVILLVIIDSLAKGHNKNVIFAFLLYSMVVLNDGDIFTLLLTGGVFLLLIFLYGYRSIRNKKTRRYI